MNFSRFPDPLPKNLTPARVFRIKMRHNAQMYRFSTWLKCPDDQLHYLAKAIEWRENALWLERQGL
jgi:hypothetical protein